MKTVGIILAGGRGDRFGSHIPKQFVSLNGKPVIQYSIDALEPACDEIILVSDVPYKDYTCVPSGITRSESVWNAVNHLRDASPDFVVIHDGNAECQAGGGNGSPGCVRYFHCRIIKIEIVGASTAGIGLNEQAEICGVQVGGSPGRPPEACRISMDDCSGRLTSPQ